MTKILRPLIFALVCFWLAARISISPHPEPAPLPALHLFGYRDTVEDIRKLLWPGMPLNLTSGPEDAVYGALDPGDLPALFAYWKAHRESLSFLAEAWDCDDFAREFLLLSRAWGAHEWAIPAAVMVGAAYVHLNGDYPLFPGSTDVRANHVLNVLRCSDGNWYFFEPQTSLMIPIEAPLYEGVIEVLKIQI